MEVLFCILYYFFTDPPQKSQRRDGQAKENAGKISHPVAQKEKQGTEQQEVADGAAKHSGHHIEAQDPAAGIQGVEEEPQGHQEPKEEVQQAAQPAPPAPAAEDAKAVVHDPGPQAQDQGREERGELTGNRDAHISAEQAGEEAALGIPALLIGQGIDAALYFQIATVQTELFDVEILPRTIRTPLIVSITILFSSKLSTSSTPETVSCSRPSRIIWWSTSAPERSSSCAMVHPAFPKSCYYVYGTTGRDMPWRELTQAPANRYNRSNGDEKEEPICSGKTC